MYINNKILVGKNDSASCELLLSKANRHGLITGATGSGKTVTVKVLAESFSDAGVPVFLADVKGDLAGCASIGEANDKINERINKLNLEGFYFESYPVHFWDLFGMKGHPVRVKVSDVGSEILSIMLGLSETQEGVLAIVFKIAKDENFKLVDLKDLRAALQYVGDNRKKYATSYGNVTIQSIGGIQRSLLILENQGANNFFGEPSLDIKDFIRCSSDGRGIINILDAVELFKSPDLYASFLLWLLTSLYNTLEEVGDLDKPKIVFFFDEAHLLFNNMPAYRLKQITRIVKLIRSKGIGLYFISQGPTDIPDDISSQLANRIQHSLHAYTPSEMRVVTAAADSFRTNPSFNTKDAILELGTCESFQEFIFNRQMGSERVLNDYPLLNMAFSCIYAKYKDLIVGDNSLVPIDTNAKNIMVTDTGEVKFIDPGELISGPILMGYGDFVAHTYKTELYGCLIQKLSLSEDDLKRLRIYAIFSSLNILAFLKKLGVDDLQSVIPYGNKYSFYSLIEEHLRELGVSVKVKK